MLFISMAAALIDPDRFSLAYTLVMDFVMLAYYIQGASILTFIFTRQRSTGVAVFIIILLTLLFPMAISLFGIFEHAFNLRKRFNNAPKDPPTF